MDLKKEERGNLQFIVLGDWGEKGNFFQRPVAESMEKYISEEKIDFILTTGDNFYEKGVNDINDSHFKKSFEDIYRFNDIMKWHITLGNHDYMGDIQALIDYGEKNENWFLPNTYYSFQKKISNANDVLFLITDTNEYIHLFNTIYYRSYIKKEKGVKQLMWMSKNLSKNMHWKIAVGHHPIYSAGAHGDTEELQKGYLKILEDNEVDIYFAGHDHDLQYLKHPNKKIHFFISGSGSKIRELKYSPYSVFAAAKPGFLIVSLTLEFALIRFIDQFGKEIYRVKIEK